MITVKNDRTGHSTIDEKKLHESIMKLRRRSKYGRAGEGRGGGKRKGREEREGTMVSSGLPGMRGNYGRQER